MKIEQILWTSEAGYSAEPSPDVSAAAQLVFVFGSTDELQRQSHMDHVRSSYPKALIFGCSTAGEIRGIQVHDNSLVITAIALEHTRIKGVKMRVSDARDSFALGETMVQNLDKEELAHVFVLLDGSQINSDKLLMGLYKNLPEGVTVTGGLAGDGDRFESPMVCYDGRVEGDAAALVGFYGSRIKVGYGSMGGWDPFGTERLITKSKGRVLYELDNQPALQLYKKYLGKHADGLPATALLFPLSLRIPGQESGLVRTIMSIDEEEQGMTFAGEMPEGTYARLMKANLERLIDGAMGAAELIYKAGQESPPDLALLVSCVGRKMVLKQRVEEEVEGVLETLGKETVLAGYYSYGEISPILSDSQCQLHNQTMTITTLSER